ncbi:PucR family transcriptional regulator [Frondihabitans cladoniiphilus]|uniref:PucR family transcriptional regulator n=1 Tax=Frondihabitans cladoniiphilus TaxID=715785 RepID=A0ABP8W5U4_9MICO
MDKTSPPTIRGLLAETALRLRPRLTGAHPETPIDWVHSSDLTDPTPFLSGHTMLLTTGTQFPDDAVDQDAPGGADADDYYDAYVDRIVAAGVVGIGFGLEVIREGTPPSLVRACRERDVTLVEVPYEIPFIALIRWVADRISAREHERDAWTLRAQRAVSVAALTTGTLDAVARVLAEQVGGTVVILSAAGDVVRRTSGTPSDIPLDAITTEARRMLGRGTRASVDLTLPGWSGFATVQTLGPRGSLRGAVGVVGAGRNDLGMQAVVTGAIAIAEVLLAKDDERRRLENDLGGMLVRLLLDGQVVAASAVAAELDRSIPDPLRVGVVRLSPERADADRPGSTAGADSDLGSDIDADALDTAARSVVDVLAREVGAVADIHDRALVFVVPAAAVGRLERLIDGGRGVEPSDVFRTLSVGLSAELSPAEVASGRAQALRILARSDGPGLAVFGVTAAGLLDDLWSPEAADVARRRLSALRGEPGDLLQCSRLWLTHNGHWESAAREAGLHRHTLKARVARVGTLLALDLETFAGRAELWALLEASDTRR